MTTEHDYRVAVSSAENVMTLIQLLAHDQFYNLLQKIMDEAARREAEGVGVLDPGKPDEEPKLI